MKLSARNVLKGEVAGLGPGVATTIVTIDLGGGVIVTRAIARAAVGAADVLVGKP